MSSFLERGRQNAEEFLRRGVDAWVDEGRITRVEGDAVLSSLRMPEVAHAVLHLGAHFAISVPLRFPLGATARFLYTFLLRVQAEATGLLRRKRPDDARRCHTFLVILVALLPGFGRLAYFFSPALAGEKLLVLISSDQVCRRLPFRLYVRLHLSALFAYWAAGEGSGFQSRWLRPSVFVRGVTNRLRALRAYAPALAAVLAVDAIAFAIGTYIYVASDRSSIWWFNELGVIAILDVAQLLVAGFAGIMAYRAFWRVDGQPMRDAAGIFLWGFGGVGLLIFAIDDFLGLHENVGDAAHGLAGFLPEATNSADDFLVIGYAIVGVAALFMFRAELFASRESSTLLLLGAAASIVMVVADAFAHTEALKALELPAQTLAATLLMFAFLARYREVVRVQEAATSEIAKPVTVGEH